MHFVVVTEEDGTQKYINPREVRLFYRRQKDNLTFVDLGFLGLFVTETPEVIAGRIADCVLRTEATVYTENDYTPHVIVEEA